MSILDHTPLVITRVKQCKNIELLKRMRHMYANDMDVQSAIITRARELHEAEILKNEASSK